MPPTRAPDGARLFASSYADPHSVAKLHQRTKHQNRYDLHSPVMNRMIGGSLLGEYRIGQFDVYDELRKGCVHHMIDLYQGDNLPILRSLEAESFDLIYVDPPFNTGRDQTRDQLQTTRDEDQGDRIGFKGKKYRTVKLGSKSFADSFDDFLEFIEPRLLEAYRLLKPNGSFFLHLDYREIHYVKVLLDQIFGRTSFINEIIWAYDYGARSKSKWSAKHDTILWYVKDPKNYTFNFDEMDRIPYMAPGLVGPEKAARGKTPTDVWWHTIVSPNGKEKTGYPTQKPEGILSRIVKVHSNPGDQLLDFFAGSGTLGQVAQKLDRNATLIDISDQAIAVIQDRLQITTTEKSAHHLPIQAAPAQS